MQKHTRGSRRLISYGSPFETAIGYSRAVVDGDFVFVSGTTGFDYTTMSIAQDVIAQTEQCFRNIGKVLSDAGSHFDQIVRVRYILPNRADFKRCCPIFKKYLGRSRPAATMIVAELLDDRMKIEIEVTAKVASSP